LRSGDHKKIQNWKKEESVKRTMEKRPDLITKAQLNSGELSLLKGLDNKTF
jgi:tRNA (guanine37-N1)-methyltransferase